MSAASYHANILKECVDDEKISSGRLLYTLILSTGVNLDDVKSAYETNHATALLADVARIAGCHPSGEGAGNYEKLILQLINVTPKTAAGEVQ